MPIKESDKLPNCKSWSDRTESDGGRGDKRSRGEPNQTFSAFENWAPRPRTTFSASIRLASMRQSEWSCWLRWVHAFSRLLTGDYLPIITTFSIFTFNALAADHLETVVFTFPPTPRLFPFQFLHIFALRIIFFLSFVCSRRVRVFRVDSRHRISLLRRCIRVTQARLRRRLSFSLPPFRSISIAFFTFVFTMKTALCADRMVARARASLHQLSFVFIISSSSSSSLAPMHCVMPMQLCTEGYDGDISRAPVNATSDRIEL